MRLYYLSSLVVYTFGFFAFSSIFLLWWKGISLRTLRLQHMHLVDGGMSLYSAIWFLVNLFLLLTELQFIQQQTFLSGLLTIMSLNYPPLIMHFYFMEERDHLSTPFWWRLSVLAVYAISLLSSSVFLLILAGRLPFSLLTLFPFSKGSFNLLNILMTVLFAFAALYCISLTTRSKPNILPASEKRHRRVNLILFALMMALFCIALFYTTAFLGLLMRSLPLIFIFTTAYYTQRFYFYDVFVKRGFIMLLTLLALMAFFAILFPAVEQPSRAWTTPWIYTLFLLPIMMGAPWLYGKLEHWLDRVWFGRKFTSLEAGRYFSEGLSKVIDEDQLKEIGEKLLGDIFQAPVLIKTSPDDHSIPLFRPEISLPIRSHVNNLEEGTIQIGTRCSQAPFLSEDIQLLNSLASSFTYLRDNLKVQRQRQVQEQHEQELRLHASRSELKALRAQINPHFLFNALNAIAGLIHRNPNRAEETVEQLAEIFRYTLKRSEKEWVRLEEEIDFIRAYLEVEQARFGERLQARIEVLPEILDIKIPCMMVQTLIENAIKHGVSAIRGTGLIHLKAWRTADHLQVQVIDNGPGIDFSPSLTPPNRHESTSYGLRNIQERLQGYFGAQAQFQLNRDPSNQFTIAALMIPLTGTADFERPKL
jgi:hypothetical protein